MQDIEREAMDMQLQDKLLSYKREMGLLPGASTSSRPALAEGDSSSAEQSEAALNDGTRTG
jgi:hypothetical protein